MYLDFYGLQKQPFHITPDPEFLYLSPSHKEALASIIYGIKQRKGFVAIIGAIGVGKTTILRSYLETAEKKHLKIVYIFNARLTFEELLKTIFRELGLGDDTTDVFEKVNRLYEVLISEYKEDNTVVLVIDEAQNMPVKTLEDLRMLSNLETPKDKLIQIVLVGQPEFEEGLRLDRLKQLNQRLAIKSTVLPLTLEESLDYIKLRLQRAGSNHSSIFTNSALIKITKRAQGIPRVLNILCDNALITGFGYQQKPVTTKVIEEIIKDFDGSRKSTAVRWWIPVASALGIVVLILLFSLMGREVIFQRVKALITFSENQTAVTSKESKQTETTKAITQNLQPLVKPNENNYQPPSPSQVETQTPLKKVVVRRDTRAQTRRKSSDDSEEKVLELIQGGVTPTTDTNLLRVGSTITSPDSSYSNAPGR